MHLLNILMKTKMDRFQYSIIYAVLRQDTTERISVGIVIIDGSEITVKYSDNKLYALKYLFPKTKYEFISRAVRGLPNNNSIKSKRDIDYLSRYSNNLITFSPLQTINLEPTEENKQWLFENYVEPLHLDAAYHEPNATTFEAMREAESDGMNDVASLDMSSIEAMEKSMG